MFAADATTRTSLPESRRLQPCIPAALFFLRPLLFYSAFIALTVASSWLPSASLDFSPAFPRPPALLPAFLLYLFYLHMHSVYATRACHLPFPQANSLSAALPSQPVSFTHPIYHPSEPCSRRTQTARAFPSVLVFLSQGSPQHPIFSRTMMRLRSPHRLHRAR